MDVVLTENQTILQDATRGFVQQRFPVTHVASGLQWARGEQLAQKKMIILQKETTEHRKPGDISPRGEPWPPPSVLTPQSPCTIERAVGVGTLYHVPGHYLCFCSADKGGLPPFCTGRGGSSLPVGLEAHPGSWALPPPRAALGGH